jgi:NADPH-dependent 2,4-dienoyl-CoA reductase/sulfur reductase-like enzyme
MLRRESFAGSIVMLSSDAAVPVDCPSLSKDYLAGNASEDGGPLRPTSFYSERAIDLRVVTEVVRLDPGSREIASSDGQSIRYDRLLLATGAEPVRHWILRSDQARSFSSFACGLPCHHRTRTNARRAIILGANFIRLEVAAA